MTKIYKNFIDGEWKVSSSGKTFDNVNPANRQQVLGRFQQSNKQDVAEAVLLTGARQVDVSSGVEVAPGVKDNELIAAFIAAAQGDAR